MRPPSTRCDSCSTPCGMHGVVVIGEGEKDEAPMLLQRRGGRRRERAGGRRRRRPARGHAPDRSRPAERDRGDRRRRARHDVLSRRGALHGQDRRRSSGGRTRSTSTRRRPRTCRAVAKAKGLDVTEVTVVVLERDRHDDLIAELRDVRRAREPDPRRRRGALDRGLAGVHGRRPADGHRRHAGGRHLRRRDQVHGRRDPGKALAEERRGAAGARSTPATTSTGC